MTEVEIDGERRLVPGTWAPPDFKLMPEKLEEAQRVMETLLKPAGAQGVGEALMPLLLTQAMPKTEGLEAETITAFYASTSAEYARHLDRFPIDILRAACDAHVVGGSPYFPAVYEITKHAIPALERRQREAGRIAALIAYAKAPPKPAFVRESEEVRLRNCIARWEKNRNSFLAHILKRSAIAAEKRLAEIEGRAPAEWSTVVETVMPPMPPPKRTSHRQADDFVIDVAVEEPPMPDEIPE